MGLARACSSPTSRRAVWTWALEWRFTRTCATLPPRRRHPADFLGFAEILGLSDRVLVMRGGRIVAGFERSAATEESVLAAALVPQRPPAAALAILRT